LRPVADQRYGHVSSRPCNVTPGDEEKAMSGPLTTELRRLDFFSNALYYTQWGHIFTETGYVLIAITTSVYK
jgi:hypothetical protein